VAYTTPLKVLRSAGVRVEENKTTQSNVSPGDTINLGAEPFVVKGAFPEKDKSVILSVGGSVQDPADYSIDFELGEIDYNGAATGDATARYRTGPYPNSTVQNAIDSAVARFEQHTNTTFDGTETVTDEVYEPEDGTTVIPFRKRPVDAVSKVEVDEGEGEYRPVYESQVEGVDADYLRAGNLGIEFVDEDKLQGKRFEVRVTYDYGYDAVPADVEDAVTSMAVDDLARGTISGAIIDGRDNFDPQTADVQVQRYQAIMEKFRVYRMENMVELREEGTVSG